MRPIKIMRPDGSPLPENHHLDYRHDKGDFRMKVTVNADGARMVGRRIFIPLHTKDIDTARIMRDAIIIALDKSGVLSRSVQIDGEDFLKGDNFQSGMQREKL